MVTVTDGRHPPCVTKCDPVGATMYIHISPRLPKDYEGTTHPALPLIDFP